MGLKKNRQTLSARQILQRKKKASSKYVRMPHHGPKTISAEDLQKAEWRKGRSGWREGEASWRSGRFSELKRDNATVARRKTSELLGKIKRSAFEDEALFEQFRGDKWEFFVLDRWAYD
jgi:hypothetical protein